MGVKALFASLSADSSTSTRLRLPFDADAEAEAEAEIEPLAPSPQILLPVHGVEVALTFFLRGPRGVEIAATSPFNLARAVFLSLKMCSETARGVGFSSGLASSDGSC